MWQSALRDFLPTDRFRWVAVIGSRRASSAEQRQAFALAARLARQGRVVVSGLALGIDRAAHWGALSISTGRTVAIVPTAPGEPIYPRANADLVVPIVQQGALLHPFLQASQDQGDLQPSIYVRRLIERDWVLAACVQGVYVVANAEPIRGGTRWAAAVARRRGIPVARVDAAGHVHVDPAIADPGVPSWPVESPVVRALLAQTPLPPWGPAWEPSPSDLRKG